MDQMERFLNCTPIIDCDSNSIKRKAEDLTKGQEKVEDKAKSLFYFVRDEIKYNPYVPCDRVEYYKASATLERGEGFCVQKAVVLAALARATEIPARLRLAVIRNHILPSKLTGLLKTNVLRYHGYNELYLKGKWVKATAVFDLRTCNENQIIPVEFDGKKDAIFQSHNRDGKLHIEYLEDYGYYEDVPFDKLFKGMVEVCGTDYFERLNQFYKAEKKKRKTL